MQLVCSFIALAFINGTYLFISFNMDSIVSQSTEEEIEEVILTSSSSNEMELADLLDLDIFDFDVEELEERNTESNFISTNIRRTEDLVTI